MRKDETNQADSPEHVERDVLSMAVREGRAMLTQAMLTQRP